ncbi:translation initiation factor IF-2 N-terminal domain-containing protein [Candidatus Peregrinibacteria bacterium]|nr:translation initiation factor IF-2 N-terminal domain-containing protein [Candidatus Peregrinibacteria bacterium]
MSTKISDLAEKLALTPEQLKAKINELGFEVSPKARVIDNELADLILDELRKKEEELAPEEKKDVAEIYDEMIAEQREREIVRNQRKMTAGKDTRSKKSFKPVETKREIGESIEIPDIIAVKEFSEKTGVNPAKVIGELMKNGILANINQQIDFETAQIIADDLGIKLKRIRSVGGTEEFMAGDISKLIQEDDASALSARPPVVCVMGHVDHGKTRLLDAIRQTNVMGGEAGGITQHIGAYQVEKKGKLITFLDTPGHEAFTAMRARGAKVTDIAILVVASDEGVKPQTIEALNHAKEADVPIIVALTKIDKPEANIDRVKGELSEHGLQPEDWGGKTIIVPVSAVSGTALINTGTLKIMNNVIVGNTYGRIKLMKDHTGKNIRMAGPSTPVLIAGLNETPKSGDILQVVKNERIAREKAEEIALKTQQENESRMSATNQVITQLKANKVLKLVIKADTKGSLEAIKQAISKIKHEEVAVKLIHVGVGTITESDVMMASASKGMVLAFHSDFDSPNVIKTAERENVPVKKYTIIYELLDNIKNVLTGLLEPEVVEVEIGKAQVKQVFLTKKSEMIIGVRVTSGKMKNKAKLRVVRGDAPVGEGVIDSLRKVDEKAHEVGEGNDCGIKFIGNVQVVEGDILEAYAKEEHRKTM